MKKIIGWQITAEEVTLLEAIKYNFSMKSTSQVLYRLMYENCDIYDLLQQSNEFAAKQKNNLKRL